MPLNLIDNHFQNSNLFRNLPIFDEIYYEGQAAGKVQIYKALREADQCKLLSLSVIRKDEDVFWDAAEDLLDRAVKTAAATIRGQFTFDLLAFDVHKELKTFNHNELAQIIINYARKITIGAPCLVKYSSFYGILQKIGDERWGKIIFKTSVDVYKDKSSLFYLLAKRVFALEHMPNCPLIVLIHDVSMNPLFDPKDDVQQKGFAQIIEEKSKNCIDFLPELYIQDKNATRELLSGLVMP